MAAGFWQHPLIFDVAGDHAESMDSRLRLALDAETQESLSAKERGEHLALLSRWFYSSWREGIWIGFDSGSRPPWRRLVSAVSRTVHQSAPAASD
jgi:hypothetical protein